MKHLEKDSEAPVLKIPFSLYPQLYRNFPEICSSSFHQPEDALHVSNNLQTSYPFPPHFWLFHWYDVSVYDPLRRSEYQMFRQAFPCSWHCILYAIRENLFPMGYPIPFAFSLLLV